MLLFVFASLGVLVLEDEVDLSMLDMKWNKSGQLTLLVAPHLSGPNMIT